MTIRRHASSRSASGSNGRVSFQKIPSVLDIPNLIELQKDSYAQFLSDGMREAFRDISPITDFTGNLVLEFLDHSLDEPNNSEDECRDRDMTYARPLKVRVRLITKEAGDIKEVKEQDIFMGDFPFMTSKGTFVINGAERVIVSQLVRSPGIYFEEVRDIATNQPTYKAQVIPNRGAWLEFESDVARQIMVRIDKTRKLAATVLIRALAAFEDKTHWGDTDQEILELFNNDPIVVATMAKEGIENKEEALIEIYRKLRPGDPPSLDSARTLLGNLFFDAKRYNMAKVDATS